jgi:hypothetical protein
MVFGQFSLDHFRRDIGKNADNLGILALEGKSDGFDVEKIAQENGYVGPPAGVNRFSSPAEIGVIDDIIVDEAGGVDELDQRGHENVLIALIIEELGAEDEESRPYSFALLLEKIRADLGNQPVRGVRKNLQVPFDSVQVPLNVLVDVAEVFSLLENTRGASGGFGFHR